MSWIWRKVTALPVGRICRRLMQPGMIPIFISMPQPKSVAESSQALFPDEGGETILNMRKQLLGNQSFFSDLTATMHKVGQYHDIHDDWFQFLYLVTRLAKPMVVVETGVFAGLSTAFILQAIKDNGRGRLVSVDLPAENVIVGSTDRMHDSALPPGCDPGWIVPPALKVNHSLVVGNSQEVLPRVFEKHRAIDVFIHDSLHTAAHQSFEYAIAWSRLREGGILLSDDIFWSPAFHEFCRKHRKPYLHVVEGRGAVRK
ncbi:MAG: class I SAM-dependent methyltransferase [Candidatus Omnitrophota bacterium]|nr:class I SAM-dependent methyltransferase [Candidatus Omnitrophota bacterium]